MIAEMMGSAPAVKRHPDVPVAAAAAAVEVDADGGEVVAMEGLPSDDEEDAGNAVETSPSGSVVRFGRPTMAAMPARASSPTQDEEHGPDEAQASGPPDAADSNTIDAFAVEHKIPISHQVLIVHDGRCFFLLIILCYHVQVSLRGHTKAVTCISIEPAGNRVVTGSLDYMVKIYDFGGMDNRHLAFRSAEADEGHPIKSICHSSTGDKYIIGTGSTQPRVFDRDGQELIKFCRGDMYLRDLSNTKVIICFC
jgi:hypothetical protein